MQGDIGSLNALTSLQIGLHSTLAQGDIGSLSALTNLQIYIHSATVQGDIGSLNALTSLRELDPRSTSCEAISAA